MTTPLQHTSLGELGYTPLLASSLGELGSATVGFTPGGGLTDSGYDAMRGLQNLRKITRRNIRNLLILSSLFVVTQEETYEGREEENDADPSD